MAILSTWLKESGQMDSFVNWGGTAGAKALVPGLAAAACPETGAFFVIRAAQKYEGG